VIKPHLTPPHPPTPTHQDKATDQAGVQSLVAAVFMSAAFGAMINMTTSVPVILQMRSVFYRESNSSMYLSAVYALSFILCELPWLFLIMWLPGTMGYFMYGLIPSGAAWGFHMLVCYTLATVYISMGTMVASIAPTFEVAQAILGLLGPLFFLFGGMWSPPSQMFMGAKWFCFIDPIFYAFRAIIPQQFVCSVDSPAFCAKIPIAIPGTKTVGQVPPCAFFVAFMFNAPRALNLHFNPPPPPFPPL
jgi:ABC-type multidrug transport system permease subunit